MTEQPNEPASAIEELREVAVNGSSVNHDEYLRRLALIDAALREQTRITVERHIAILEELDGRIRKAWQAECGTEEHSQELWFALDAVSRYYNAAMDAEVAALPRTPGEDPIGSPHAECLIHGA